MPQVLSRAPSDPVCKSPGLPAVIGGLHSFHHWPWTVLQAQPPFTTHRFAVTMAVRPRARQVAKLSIAAQDCASGGETLNGYKETVALFMGNKYITAGQKSPPPTDRDDKNNCPPHQCLTALSMPGQGQMKSASNVKRQVVKPPTVEPCMMCAGNARLPFCASSVTHKNFLPSLLSSSQQSHAGLSVAEGEAVGNRSSTPQEELWMTLTDNSVIALCPLLLLVMRASLLNQPFCTSASMEQICCVSMLDGGLCTTALPNSLVEFWPTIKSKNA